MPHCLYIRYGGHGSGSDMCAAPPSEPEPQPDSACAAVAVTPHDQTSDTAALRPPGCAGGCADRDIPAAASADHVRSWVVQGVCSLEDLDGEWVVDALLATCCANS